MKIIASMIAIVILGATIVQLYTLHQEKILLEKNLKKVTAQVENVTKENKSLEAEIDYYKDPKNLEREARIQFNYASPDEKLLIIVQKK